MTEAKANEVGGAILVVDDTTANLQFLTDLLTASGFSVFPASDGELALEFVRTTLPDLVLLDVRMPGMDGYEVCRRLKADETTRSIPVIFISILEDERDKVKAFQAGAVDYVTKPFQPEEVLARIRTHLRLRELTERLEQTIAARTAELTQERDRVSSIMEASPVAMTRLDRDGQILYANAAAERILGIHRQEITSRHFDAPEWRISDPAGAPLPSSELPFAIVARTLAPARVRHAIQWPEGRRVLVEVFGAPLLDVAGAFDGAVMAFEDVTERSQLEEQLLQAQKMEAVGRLADGVAHDFNNLLTVILAASNDILEGVPDSSRVEEGAREIRLAAERAAALSRRLLTFSRKQVVVPRVIALDELVTGILPMLRRLIGDDVELVARTGARGYVRADPGQIEQVIMNLVVNARDAMPDGGRITLETEDLDVGREEAREHLGVQPGPFVALIASDTGTGMNAEVLSHLFEPFYTTKEPEKGTGLGLSTVYGIVKQAGGHMHVRSTKGAGTVFRIHLPRVEASGEELTPCGGAAARVAPPAAVLLVEDEPQVRSAILRALSRAGHHVTETADAEDALRRAADLAQPIDVLVTDVVMPRLGGKELASRIRALRPGIKVLFVSGYVERSFSLDDLGEDVGFLQKPFGPDELAEAVGALLMHARVRAVAGR